MLAEDNRKEPEAQLRLCCAVRSLDRERHIGQLLGQFVLSVFLLLVTEVLALPLNLHWYAVRGIFQEREFCETVITFTHIGPQCHSEMLLADLKREVCRVLGYARP